MEKTENRSIGLNKNVTRVIKGSIFSIVISIILLLIYATVLTYTNVSENTMTVVLIAISGISILIGSSISSFKIKKQGMLNGALVGLIYMIFIYLLSSILISRVYTWYKINYNDCSWSNCWNDRWNCWSKFIKIYSTFL